MSSTSAVQQMCLHLLVEVLPGVKAGTHTQPESHPISSPPIYNMHMDAGLAVLQQLQTLYLHTVYRKMFPRSRPYERKDMRCLGLTGAGAGVGAEAAACAASVAASRASWSAAPPRASADTAADDAETAWGGGVFPAPGTAHL